MPRVDEESPLLGEGDAGLEKRRVGVGAIRYALAGSAALCFALMATLAFGGKVRVSKPEPASLLLGSQGSEKPLPPSPFVAMQGMFAYGHASKNQLECKVRKLDFKCRF